MVGGGGSYAFDGLNSVGDDLFVDLASHVFGLEVGCTEPVGELSIEHVSVDGSADGYHCCLTMGTSWPSLSFRFGRCSSCLGSAPEASGLWEACAEFILEYRRTRRLAAGLAEWPDSREMLEMVLQRCFDRGKRYMRTKYVSK